MNLRNFPHQTDASSSYLWNDNMEGEDLFWWLNKIVLNPTSKTRDLEMRWSKMGEEYET